LVNEMRKGPTIKAGRGSRGFTLVEMMIAVFVLTVALIGLISVTTTIIKGNDFSRRMTTASTLAKDKIEELKKKPFTTVASGVTTDYWNIDSSAGATGAYFTRISTVTDNTPAANMKTIEVEVRWTWAELHTVTLRSIIGA
jgi:type IV pilus assembly protein PilV